MAKQITNNNTFKKEKEKRKKRRKKKGKKKGKKVHTIRAGSKCFGPCK